MRNKNIVNFELLVYDLFGGYFTVSGIFEITVIPFIRQTLSYERNNRTPTDGPCQSNSLEDGRRGR